MSISKNGTPILSLDDWEAHCGPLAVGQWVDGRSTKEAARAWLDDGADLPKEVATLLKRHEAFGRVATWSAEPGVALPSGGTGESWRADLVVDAEDEIGPYLIVVDAMGDEPFGDTLGDTLAAVVERIVEDAGSDGGSDGLARVTRRVTALLGPRLENDPPLKDLRYPLLMACAGCLCEAERRGRTRVLLLIHEFVTERTQDKKLLGNAIDLGRFVKRLSHGAFSTVGAGDLRGPITVPGAPLLSGRIDLFVGKVARNTRTKSADRDT